MLVGISQRETGKTSSSSFAQTTKPVALTKAAVCKRSGKDPYSFTLTGVSAGQVSVLEDSGGSDSSAADSLLSLEMCRRGTLQNDQYGAW